MIRAHIGLKLSLLLTAGAVALVVPQAGSATPLPATSAPGSSATSGGAGLGGSGGTGLGGSSTPVVVTQPANLTVSATGNGITIVTGESALMRQTVQFTGNAPAGDAGDIVEIERMGPQPSSNWVPTAQGTVAIGGSFAVSWRASQSGLFSIKAALLPATVKGTLASAGGGATLALQTATAASAALTMTVYRPAVATWYGGATMFGKRTACGGILRPTTLGVANRTLRCGTRVRIYYGGRSIVVPVIDRGPYVTGVSWDLSEATANAIGMLSIGRATIGTVAL